MKTYRFFIILFLILIHLFYLYSANRDDNLTFKVNKKLIKYDSKKIHSSLKYKDTFIVKFKKGEKELHFIAVAHSNDPKSLTYKTIDSEFKSFNPEIVIVERESSEMGISPDNIKQRFKNSKKRIHGEPDYAVYLAVNNRGKNIDFLLAEPSTDFVLENIKKYTIQKSKLTEKDVLFFYTIRTLRDFIKRNSINSKQKLDEKFPNLLKERIKKYGFNESLNNSSLNDFMEWYRDKMGFNFDYKNFPDFSPIGTDNISKINNYLSYIRDTNIVNNIEKIINKYNKILIVYGMAHYIRMKSVLIDMFDHEPEEIQLIKNSRVEKKDEKNIYDLIKSKVKKRYSAWIDLNDIYSTMFYGDIKDFNKLKFCKDYLATGWSHLIYYENKTKKKNLYSIILLAKHYGNQDNNFYLMIQDLKGKTIYQSKKYKYSEFPKDEFQYKEFVIDIKNIPQEFIIILKTSSSPKNGIYIISIPSSKNIYSFEYSNPTRYKEYNKENAAIFPKFY